MRTLTLALCVALAATVLLPVASACCIHTTRTVAWAEYAQVGDATVCAVVSAPTPLQQDGCALAVDGGHSFDLLVADGSSRPVSLAWEACGASGAGVARVPIAIPEGCETVHVTLGPEATAGVLRLGL